VTLAAEPAPGTFRHIGMHTTRVAAVLMICGSFLLLGCSAGSSGGGSVSAPAAGNEILGARAAAPAAGGGSTANLPAAGQRSAGATELLTEAGQIIYTAQLTIRAQNVGTATGKATAITAAAGGYVSSETATAGSGATASLQVKIPVPGYPATLSELESELGTQLSLQEQAQNVTEEVADVNSQVTSDEAAIVQLRDLLSHAGSVSDLLNVQNQINSEESSLEAIQAQQRVLAGQTSYATVTLTILGPKAKAVVHHKTASSPSAGSGLRAGWHALRVALTWTIAGIAAVAPFALILAVGGFLVYRGRRWALRRHPTS
jgi:hypothetical protein